jgi:hypothetical protein
VSSSALPPHLDDDRDHSARYVGKPFIVIVPELSKKPYGPFKNYEAAFDVLVEQYGSEDEVPESVEIDVLFERSLKLNPAEMLEVDIKLFLIGT